MLVGSAVQGLGVAPAMNFKTVCIIFGKFSYLFALSLIFGIACGFASSLLLKKFPATGTPQVHLSIRTHTGS